MPNNNFLNNGSLDGFLEGMGGAIVGIVGSTAVSNGIGSVIAGAGGMLASSNYQAGMGQNPMSKATPKLKDLSPRTGIKKFFTFYIMDANGVIQYDANGSPVLDMVKVIAIPSGALLLIYVVYKSLRLRRRTKKKARRF